MAAVMAVAVVSSSCRLFHRSAKANVPPAPKPAAAETKLPPPVTTPPKTEAAAMPEPPQLPPQATTGTQPPPYSRDSLPPPPRPRRTRHETPEPPAATPAAEVPAAQAAVPQLEQILTPEQQAAYNDEIDRNIARAQRTVGQLSGRPLTAEQKVYLDRIRAFIQQASDARKTDLFRAKNLAERASVLAEDLLKSVQ